MKHKVLLYSLLATSLLMTACFGKKTDYEYHGFLYSDSTMTNPIGGAVLTFGGTQPYYSSDAGYWQLGSAVTDSNGYWQFLHIRSQNSEQQNSAKWSRDADFLMITYNGDTLFWYYDGFKDTLKFYPGCSWNPYPDK